MAKSGSFNASDISAQSQPLSLWNQIVIVLRLSLPGMIAQLSSILMQYIDSAMVGSLGASASASIGLVVSSTWLIGSLLHGAVIGFTVQVAHCVGAGEKEKAKTVFSTGLRVSLLFSILLAAAAGAISPKLPYWLGASDEIARDAFRYFLIYALSCPLYQTVYLMSGMLQCSGNMKVPGFLNGAMCFLDIFFNWIFIFVLKFGVTGAALGSSFSALTVALIISAYTLLKSELFKVSKKGGRAFDFDCVKKAVRIALPVAVESSAFSGALVVITRIIAPLGAVSISANAFATTAESLCYMPGYGIAEAATTLTGQSFGAKRRDLVRSFSYITVIYGVLLMTILAAAMYFLCPAVFRFITPDLEIQALSVKVLRIQLFAEPLFGASIVATGVLRGKGDTFIPSLLNLFSLWVVRLGLSLILIKPLALPGIWIAMACELCFRGIVLLARMIFAKN